MFWLEMNTWCFVPKTEISGGIEKGNICKGIISIHFIDCKNNHLLPLVPDRRNKNYLFLNLTELRSKRRIGLL